MQDREIRYCGKPPGRPRKTTTENKAELTQEKQQRQADYRERIPIEGKFGQGKNGYGLGYIRAKTAKTSESWIRSISFAEESVSSRASFSLAHKTNGSSRKKMGK